MSELPVRPDELVALGALFAPGIVADPYPAYAQWRAKRPIARPRERLYVLSRFADCEAVLADPAFGRAEDGQDRPLSEPVPGGESQREMAYRFGVNLVMYALTGNYKADSVHAPALLQRLGR